MEKTSLFCSIWLLCLHFLSVYESSEPEVNFQDFLALGRQTKTTFGLSSVDKIHISSCFGAINQTRSTHLFAYKFSPAEEIFKI